MPASSSEGYTFEFAFPYADEVIALGPEWIGRQFDEHVGQLGAWDRLRVVIPDLEVQHVLWPDERDGDRHRPVMAISL